MSTQTTINCPNCSTQIDVNQILYHQLEDEMKKKFSSEVAEHRKKYKDAISQLRTKEAAFQEQEESFNDKVNKQVQQQLNTERQQLSESIKEKVLEAQSGQMSLMQNELDEKSEQVKELNRSKAEIDQGS